MISAIARVMQLLVLLSTLSNGLGAQTLRQARAGVHLPSAELSSAVSRQYRQPPLASAQGHPGMTKWIAIGALTGAVLVGGIAAYEVAHQDDSFIGGQLVVGGAAVGAVAGGLAGELLYAMDRSSEHQNSARTSTRPQSMLIPNLVSSGNFGTDGYNDTTARP